MGRFSVFFSVKWKLMSNVIQTPELLDYVSSPHTLPFVRPLPSHVNAISLSRMAYECVRNELASSCKRQFWRRERNSIDTYVARSKLNNPAEAGAIWRVRKLFSTNPKIKTNSTRKRYNLSHLSLHWTMCGGCWCLMCVRVYVRRQSNCFMAEPRACVSAVHANDYAQAAYATKVPDPRLCLRKELYQKIIYARISIILSCTTHTHTHTYARSRSPSHFHAKQFRKATRKKKWIFHWYVNRTNWNCTLKILIRN